MNEQEGKMITRLTAALFVIASATGCSDGGREPAAASAAMPPAAHASAADTPREIAARVLVFAPGDLETHAASQPLVASSMIVRRADYSLLSDDEIDAALRAATSVVHWPSRTAVRGTFEPYAYDGPDAAGYRFLQFHPADPTPATGWLAVIVNRDSLPWGYADRSAPREQVVRFSLDSRPVVTEVRSQPVDVGGGDLVGYPARDVSRDFLWVLFSEPVDGSTLYEAVSLNSSGTPLGCVPYRATPAVAGAVKFVGYQCPRFHDGQSLRVHLDTSGPAARTTALAATDLDLILRSTGEGRTAADGAALLTAAGLSTTASTVGTP